MNGVPALSNRQTEQVVRVSDGQPSLITGIIDKTESNSMVGTPFLAQIPVLGYLFGQRTKNVQEDEVIMIVTPHIVSQPAGATEASHAIPWPADYLPIAQ